MIPRFVGMIAKTQTIYSVKPPLWSVALTQLPFQLPVITGLAKGETPWFIGKF